MATTYQSTGTRVQFLVLAVRSWGGGDVRWAFVAGVAFPAGVGVAIGRRSSPRPSSPDALGGAASRRVRPHERQRAWRWVAALPIDRCGGGWRPLAWQGKPTNKKPALLLLIFVSTSAQLSQLRAFFFGPASDLAAGRPNFGLLTQLAPPAPSGPPINQPTPPTRNQRSPGIFSRRNAKPSPPSPPVAFPRSQNTDNPRRVCVGRREAADDTRGPTTREPDTKRSRQSRRPARRFALHNVGRGRRHRRPRGLIR